MAPANPITDNSRQMDAVRLHRAASGQCLTTSESATALFTEWCALHAAVPGAGPFAHPAWHATWLAHFGASSGAEPVYLAVREGETLIGVAALDMAAPGRARTLGDPNVCDYGGPLARPGCEAAVARGVLEWLGEDMTPALELWGVRAGSVWPAALTSAADAHGWSCDAAPDGVAPLVALPATFDEYIAGLPKHDRHELRRKLRRLQAAGETQLTEVCGEAMPPGLEQLFGMMRDSHDGKRQFLADEMEQFFRALAAAFAPTGSLRLWRLDIGGQAAAMVLGFVDDQALYLYNSGYDPRLAHLAPGLLSKVMAMREAIARGCSRFELLRGGEHYKTHLGGADGHLFRLTLRRRSASGATGPRA